MKGKNRKDGFLTIKEFARLVGMTPAALRHYDWRGVFQPAKHGVDLENKYRLYAPTQITTVNMIRVLAEIGVPLDTVKVFAEERTPEKLMKLLSKQRDILLYRLDFIQESLLLIGTHLELLNSGISATEDEIYVSEMPEKRIIMGDVNDFEGSDIFFRGFTRFCKETHEPKLNLSYPICGYWDSMDEFMRSPSLPYRFFALDPSGHDRKPAGLYLIGYTRGYYGQTNGLPERMSAFAKENGLVFDGPVYNVYLLNELSIADENQYLLQVSASVKETRRSSSRRTYKP